MVLAMTTAPMAMTEKMHQWTQQKDKVGQGRDDVPSVGPQQVGTQRKYGECYCPGGFGAEKATKTVKDIA
jgi:hypothetical protein